LKRQTQLEKKRLAKLKTKEHEVEKQRRVHAQAEAKKLATIKQKQQAEEKRLAEIKEKAKITERQEKIKAEAQSKQQAISAAQTKQMQTEVEKYKSFILQAVGQNWIVLDKVNKKLSCKFSIRLAPDGTVLSVTLIKGSGDGALDRAARIAIYKASPLPVPDKPEIFEKFRELSLTMRPEGLLSAG